jgi:hypothetical protein
LLQTLAEAAGEPADSQNLGHSGLKIVTPEPGWRLADVARGTSEVSVEGWKGIRRGDGWQGLNGELLDRAQQHAISQIVRGVVYQNSAAAIPLDAGREPRLQVSALPSVEL